MLLRSIRRRQQQRREELLQALRSAAATLGLDFSRPWLKLKGNRAGRAVAYSYSPTREYGGSGANCSVAFSGGKLGIKLRIRRRSPTWSPPWVKSAVTTGDPAFDALIVVKTSRPDQLLPALDGTTTRLILDLAYDGRLHITDSRIAFSDDTKDQPTAVIVDTVRRLESVAQALERART